MSEEPRIAVGVSSCLLGEAVRYDGGHKRSRWLTDVLDRYVRWVSVCPELEIGLGVPRPTLRLVRGDGGTRVVELKTERDLTRRMSEYSQARVEELAGLGLRGYVLKNMEPDDLVDAIQRVARGEMVVAPALMLKLANMLDSTQQSQSRESLMVSLTEREREILAHLARGESNKAIARELDISHDTVKLHVRHILSKLNLTSRVEAAIFAVEHRIAP